MQEIILITLLLLVVGGATIVEPRLRVPSPLLLVLVGVAASLIPGLGQIQTPPDLVLEGLLPPLLYASARVMPPMNFRREFRTISGLSVILVVVTALLLGLLFQWLVPDLGFAWGAVLGAIVSPTDAAATAIVKRSSLPRRAIVMLDGESLLNDATALVLMRTGIAATAGAFSLIGSIGTFAYSVAVAVGLGLLVGWLDLAIRRRISNPTVNTILSFTVPFLASIPAELLDASGLVAAVTAGLVGSLRAPRLLPPSHRLSEAQNWASLRMVLEGSIFLVMGLQLSSIVHDANATSHSAVFAVELAAIAMGLMLAIRAGYVAPLLVALHRRADRQKELQPRLSSFRDRLEDGKPIALPPRHRRLAWLFTPKRRDRLAKRAKTRLADIDYLANEPLGWREGVIVVWAGMRGAVTVAAAQSLPTETPHRPLLVLIAFAVAAISLLVQGSTLAPIVSQLYRGTADQEDEGSADSDERREITEMLHATARQVEPRGEDESPEQHGIKVLEAQRDCLLDARDQGLFTPEGLSYALHALDVQQIAWEMRQNPEI